MELIYDTQFASMESYFGICRKLEISTEKKLNTGL